MIVADIEVPDCFVSGPLKNKKETGNVGHGESRLYVGNDEAVCKTLTTKPWVFDFDNYEEAITDHEMFDFMMDNISRFTREHSLTLKVEERRFHKFSLEVVSQVEMQILTSHQVIHL